MSSTARQIIFWVLIIAGALLIYKLVNPGSKNTANIDLVQLNEKIKAGQLKELVVKQNESVAVDKDGLFPPNRSLVPVGMLPIFKTHTSRAGALRKSK